MSGCVSQKDSRAQRKAPPNFVVIFTDDQGYNDLGCFGSPNIETPRIDRMAAEGCKFTSFYVAASVCSPSRAALLTGRYPLRAGIPGVLFPNATTGLDSGEITIAEILKQRNYATACIGKWHLGHLPEFLPTRHGFDYYYGIPYSNDMKMNKEAKRHQVPLMRNEEVVEFPAVQSTLTERYTQEAIRFIEANKDRPFFVYLPHTMPHVPLHVSAHFANKSDAGLYGDVIECIDWSTGEILDAIDRLGLDDNTLVIFTSDNGPWLVKGDHAGLATPLRDGKFSTYEGGFRIPCVMRWPGRIPPATVCSEIATTMDLLPTFAQLAGVPVPKDRIIDGKDIWPLMSGTPGAQSPYEAFHYYAGKELRAVRSGKWKMVFGNETKHEGKVPEALYNLDADIGEQNNVIDDHPEIAEKLRQLASKMRQDLGDKLRGIEGRNRRKPVQREMR
ncbi:MAG: sulfatase-like hydrolase/transferase [Nitrospiraceae bacterium]|nr:sulfatase-like hydrolase/transferase [Nitrospiraceae bacterium]